MPMSLSFFIAKRIYRDEAGGKRASRPAIFIATMGIAIGLAVMIVAVSIIVGFKSEVRDKVAGFGSHLRIFSLEAESAYEPAPVVADDSFMCMISSYSGVKHVQRYAVKPGMVKTDEAFQGIILKGIGQEYDTLFLHRHLLERAVIHADETPCQVLKEDGKTAQSKSYMWLYGSGNDGLPPIRLYDYQPSRGGYHAEEFLKGFSGYLTCVNVKFPAPR